MVVAVALTGFLAGVGVGVAGSPAAAAAFGSPEVDQERLQQQRFVQGFERRFVSEYDLDQEQVLDLRAILLQYQSDRVRIAMSGGYEQWPEELKSQILQAQRRMDKRIQWILNADQRVRYLEETGMASGK